MANWICILYIGAPRVYLRKTNNISNFNKFSVSSLIFNLIVLFDSAYQDSLRSLFLRVTHKGSRALEELWFIFIINLCTYEVNFLCDFRRKCPRPKQIIYNHVSDNSKKWLSVGNSVILCVTCGQPPAYPSLCRNIC